MKKILLIFALGFLFSFVGAQSFCVDFDPPSAPSNLILTQSNGNILLTWGEATDEPSCSGISHYDIYKNSVFLISVDETNYLDADEFPDGTYTYTIYAFDLVGHNEGIGISNSITISSTTTNGKTPSSGGGGSRSSDDFSYWQCKEWQECIEGIQQRTCTDLSKNLPDRTETRTCTPDFIPLGNENKKIETTHLNQESSSTNFLTGAVTGATDFAKTQKETISVFAFALMIIGAFVFIKLKRK